jgi:hypothetical protein
MNRDEPHSGESGESTNRFLQQRYNNDDDHDDASATIIPRRGGEESRDESAARLLPPAHRSSSREPQHELRVLPSDVLCGRGKASFNHGTCHWLMGNQRRASDSRLAFIRYAEGALRLLPLFYCTADGNRRFRDSIAAWLPRYRDAVHLFDKALIVDAVIGEVRQSGGRFLRYDHFASRAVNELSEHQVKEKVGRALRDAVASGEAAKRPAKRRRSSGSAETKADYPGDTPKLDLPSRRDVAGRRVGSWSGPTLHPSDGARDLRGGPEPPTASVAASAAASDDAHEHFLAAINSVLGPAHAEEASPLHGGTGRKDSTDESDPFHHQFC